jgi:Tfp pilus assembly protein PilN
MMITINLRPGQKRKRPASGRNVLAQVKELGTRIKEPLLLVAIAAWTIVGAGLVYSTVSVKNQLSAVQPKFDRAVEEHKRFKTLLDEKRKAERIRDSLLTQIAVIRTVDGDRYIWPHVLDEVAKALPPYTWLTSIRVLSAPVAPADTTGADTVAAVVNFEVQGRTVDIQAYTKLLRQLEASPWISDVTALEAKTLVEQERPVTGFTIKATFRKADSAYIRTVPLSQSVR